MGVIKRGDIYYISYFFGGRRIRKAVGKNKKTAEAAFEKIRVEIRAGRYIDLEKPAIPFRKLAEKFLEWGKLRKSYVSLEACVSPALAFFGDKPAHTITEQEVEAYRVQRKDTPTKAEDPAKRRPRSNSTVNHELAALKQVFNKGIAWGLIDRNPAAGVKPLPESRGRVRFLTVEEAAQLLAAASRHLRPIIMVALETGMRRGEILGLKWSDIDLKNGTLFIEKTKNGESRHVPISARLREEFLRMPRRLGVDHVFVGQEKAGKPGRKGKIGNPNTPFHDVRTAFENACKKAGIDDFRFHDLRHTAASHLAMAGVPLKTIGEILGHKTATMTERYSHLTPEHKNKAVNMLPDWENAGACGSKVAQGAISGGGKRKRATG